MHRERERSFKSREVKRLKECALALTNHPLYGNITEFAELQKVEAVTCDHDYDGHVFKYNTHVYPCSIYMVTMKCVFLKA